jgi:TolB-like protein/tetratricopeptide (TPR) repeat protein
VALGVNQDICGELTRFRGLRVIAPASSAHMAAASDSEIGERLAASHVVRGRLRRTASGERTLTVDLSAVETLAQLWSERFVLPGGDPAETGDAVVARIAATLSARIEDSALLEARRRPSSGLEAWELTLRGLILIRDATRESDEAARELFLKALALDPLHARAHAGMALSWFNEWSCQFWDRFEEASRQAYVHARRALELDDRDAMIHLVISKVALFQSEWEQAAWYLDRAIMLCPNDADLLVQAAVLEVYLGRPEVAVEHVERAMELNPLHPNVYYLIAAFARVFTGDYAEALALRARSDAMPFVDAAAYVAAAEAMLGRIGEAKAEFARYVAEYGEKIAFGEPFSPEAPLDWIFEINPFRRSEDMAMMREAFARIGVAVAPSRPVWQQPSSDLSLRLEREGAGWIAEFDGLRTILPDLKGLHDIRRLMDSGGREIHCLDLDERIVEAPGDTVLDERARAALKARLRDLQEDLAEAEEANDIGRAGQMREEMDSIIEALSAALGLGGRVRKLGDSVEKARTAVTWRIRHALRRIEAVHPAMGRHLARRVKTGTFCQFVVD